MALTLEERKTIETLIKKVRNLENTVDSQGKFIINLTRVVGALGTSNDMNDWTSVQWDKFLRSYITKYAGVSRTRQHNHKNDQTGGDCFAKLGANLINGE